MAESGERWLLDTLLRTPLAVDQRWHVHLYTNDYHPLASVVLADLVECSVAGYAPQELVRSQWPASSSVGGQAVAQYGANPVTFPCTGGSATYFGFYVTTEDDLTLLWVQRNDASAVIDPLHPGLAVVTFAGRSQSEPV